MSNTCFMSSPSPPVLLPVTSWCHLSTSFIGVSALKASATKKKKLLTWSVKLLSNDDNGYAATLPESLKKKIQFLILEQMKEDILQRIDAINHIYIITTKYFYCDLRNVLLSVFFCAKMTLEGWFFQLRTNKRAFQTRCFICPWLGLMN